MTYPEQQPPVRIGSSLARILRGPDTTAGPVGVNAAVAAGELRIVNPVTGGEKGSKLERYDLIPVEPWAEVARLYGAGAAKYADNNWRRGYDWHLSYAALQRHVNAFWGGESMDGETHRHHLASAVFHCLALMEYERTHPELDDRYKP